MSVFHLADDVDAGDLVVQVPVDVVPRETARTLYDKQLLALQRGLNVVLDVLEAGDDLPRTPQDHGSATWCAKRDAEDGRLDFRHGAADVDRLIRASTPALSRCIHHLPCLDAARLVGPRRECKLVFRSTRAGHRERLGCADGHVRRSPSRHARRVGARGRFGAAAPP